MRFAARIRRFFHCWWNWHKPLTGWGAADGAALWIGCRCGKVFHNECPPGYAEFMMKVIYRISND